ncbi:MAG: MFS transporter [Firmicutes bacterium]|nr:MFS transporter [Bacillota bacterium]
MSDSRSDAGRGAGRRGRRVSEKLVRRNFFYTTAEGMSTNVAFGMVNPFLPVYAIALGANSLLVGLVTALPAAANVFAYLLGADITERRPENKLATAVTWGVTHRLLYLPMGFIPFLPWFRPEAFVLLVSLAAVPFAVSVTAWTAMVGDMFPENRRGEIFGLRNMYVGLTGVMGTMAAGYFLDFVAFPFNYMYLFLAACGFALLGIYFMNRMAEIRVRRRPVERRSFGQRLRALFEDRDLGRNFRYFSLSCFMLWFGFGFTAAMWAIYHVQVLNLSNSVIGLFTVVNGLATVVSSVAWGRVAVRKGERLVLLTSMSGLAAMPALYMLSRSLIFLFGAQVFSGVMMGGLNLAVFNLLLNYAKPEERANAAAVFNMLMNAATFIAPFMGNAWYSAYGIVSTFYAGFGVRLIGLVFLWKIMDRELPGVRALAAMIRERHSLVGRRRWG